MGVYACQKKYFENAYRIGEHGWPTERPTRFVARKLATVKRVNGAGRMLDIGCGEGRHTFLFARHGFVAVGLDYQKLAIERALEIGRRSGRFGGRATFVVGDIFALPFRDTAFDVIVDYGCFHHVVRADTTRYLGAILSHLRVGGYFFLSCFSTKFRHFPGERRTRKFVVHRGHYDRFFEKKDFRPLFGRAFRTLNIEEERDGLHVFFHLLMQKKRQES